MNATRKWKGRTGGGLVGQHSLLAIFKALDVRIGYAVMAFVVPFYMIFHRKAARAIYRYFRKRLGYPPLKSLLMSYRNHYVFGQTILDRFAVFSGRRNFFRVEIIGNEHFIRLSDGDKGFIMASSHIGNFEIGGYLLGRGGKKINALVFPGETATMQRNRTLILDRNNIRLIPVSGDLSHIFAIRAALESGEIVGMPCDRNLGSSKSVRCRFMNSTALFPAGPFALAIASDVEILSVFVLKRSARRYIVYVKPIKAESAVSKQAQIESCAQAYAQAMEQILKLHPEQWFNYYEFFDD